MQDKGKIPSRNLAITMVAIDNGTKELDSLIKNSLGKYITVPSTKKQEEDLSKNNLKEESQTGNEKGHKNGENE
jgi:hypothetical protein